MATLKELRDRRALSQADLGKLAGMRAATICRLENGLQKPRPSTRRKLAKTLKVRPDEIVYTYENINK